MARKKRNNKEPGALLPSLKNDSGEREIASLRTLQRLSQDITSSLDFEDVCRAIYRGAVELMTCDAFFIALYDERAQMLDFVTRLEQGILLPPVKIQLDDGVASEVVQTRRVVHVSDVATETRFRITHWRSGPPAKSLIAAPMLLRDRVVGVLSAQSYRAGSYDEIDLQVLNNFAAQAAIAIENARLFAESRQKVKQLAALNEIGRIVSSTFEIDRLLEAIYRQVSRIIVADTYFVTLADLEKRIRTIALLVDEGQRFPPRDVPLEDGFAGYVIKRRAPLLVRDVDDEASKFGINPVPVGQPHMSKSWLGVPMMTVEHLVGTLAVASYQLNAFDESDQEILQNIAIQAAIAIDNARLFAQTQHKMKQLSVLNEVGRIVTSSIEIDQLLELLYDQVRRILKADSYHVSLYDPVRQTQRFEIVVDEGERFPSFERPLGEGLTSLVIKHRAPLLVRHASVEAPLLGATRTTVGKPRLSESWLGVPLMTSEHFLGVLTVASYEPNAFDEDDQEVLQNIAIQAAIAIDNARHHAEVEDQARRDSLTQVYNHGYFVQSLQNEIKNVQAKNCSIALIMLDIDHFKEYNDRYGHLAGDAILRGTVQAIRQNVKQTDLIGRWGGEEFAIALFGTDLDGALAVAERIRELLPRMTLTDDQGRPVPVPTVSQGIAVCPQDADQAFALVDVADRRLYQAKSRGRDQIQREG